VGEATVGHRSAPRRDPSVAWRVLDGEAVLYHDRLGSVCLLDPIATTIWQELDGVRELETISSELAVRFGSDARRVLDDVLEAVASLGAQGLIDGVRADPGVVAELQLPTPEEHVRATPGEPKYRRVPPDG
jgi:hypothetical protein